MKHRKIYRAMVLLACVTLPVIALAQGPPDPNDAPIDGGLSLLLAAGVGYGIKQYRNGKKDRNAEIEN